MRNSLMVLMYCSVTFSLFSMEQNEPNPIKQFPLLELPNEIKLEIITADLRSSKNDIEFKQNIKSLMQLRLLNKYFNALIMDYGKDFINKSISLLEKNNNHIRVFIEEFISRAIYNSQWNPNQSVIPKIKFFINTYISKKNLKELAYWSWVRDDLELGELYIKNGGDVNCICPDGEHILVKCFHRNSPKFAELLLKHGADQNCTDECLQWSILKYSILTKKINFIKLLLTYNANIQDIEDGVTALDFARKKKNPEIIELIEAKIEEQKKIPHEI